MNDSNTPPNSSEPPISSPDSEAHLLGSHSDHRRVGKIACLPKPVRDQVNQMLLDGVRYRKIIDHVRPHGTNLTNNCLTNWKQGGHQDWLKERRLLEECRLRQELTLALATENHDANSFHTAHKITAALLCEALVECGSATLRQAFQANPLNLLRAVNSLSRITAGGLKCERHLAEQAERAAQSQPPRAPKKGLSHEAFQELNQQLNLM